MKQVNIDMPFNHTRFWVKSSLPVYSKKSITSLTKNSNDYIKFGCSLEIIFLSTASGLIGGFIKRRFPWISREFANMFGKPSQKLDDSIHKDCNKGLHNHSESSNQDKKRFLKKVAPFIIPATSYVAAFALSDMQKSTQLEQIEKGYKVIQSVTETINAQRNTAKTKEEKELPLFDDVKYSDAALNNLHFLLEETKKAVAKGMFVKELKEKLNNAALSELDHSELSYLMDNIEKQENGLEDYDKNLQRALELKCSDYFEPYEMNIIKNAATRMKNDMVRLDDKGERLEHMFYFLLILGASTIPAFKIKTKSTH